MPSTAIDFHRLMVHFPVALLTFAAFFQFLAVWRRSVALQTVAKALLLAGASMGAAAVLFGFLAEEEFRNRFLEAHETLGFATLGTAVVVAALWLWKPVAEPRSRGGLLVSAVCASSPAWSARPATSAGPWPMATARTVRSPAVRRRPRRRRAK
jgi:uncharacterized membrane protein